MSSLPSKSVRIKVQVLGMNPSADSYTFYARAPVLYDPKSDLAVFVNFEKFLHGIEDTIGQSCPFLGEGDVLIEMEDVNNNSKLLEAIDLLNVINTNASPKIKALLRNPNQREFKSYTVEELLNENAHLKSIIQRQHEEILKFQAKHVLSFHIN